MAIRSQVLVLNCSANHSRKRSARTRWSSASGEMRYPCQTSARYSPYRGLVNSASISLSRRFGSVSVRKRAACSAVGMTPCRSRYTRRRNSASSAGSACRTRSASRRVSTCRSIRAASSAASGSPAMDSRPAVATTASTMSIRFKHRMIVPPGAVPPGSAASPFLILGVRDRVASTKTVARFVFNIEGCSGGGAKPGGRNRTKVGRQAEYARGLLGESGGGHQQRTGYFRGVPIAIASRLWNPALRHRERFVTIADSRPIPAALIRVKGSRQSAELKRCRNPSVGLPGGHQRIARVGPIDVSGR